MYTYLQLPALFNKVVVSLCTWTQRDPKDRAVCVQGMVCPCSVWLRTGGVLVYLFRPLLAVPVQLGWRGTSSPLTISRDLLDSLIQIFPMECIFSSSVLTQSLVYVLSLCGWAVCFILFGNFCWVYLWLSSVLCLWFWLLVFKGWYQSVFCLV